MPSRWASVAILLLWAVATVGLVTRDVLPDLRKTRAGLCCSLVQRRLIGKAVLELLSFRHERRVTARCFGQAFGQRAHSTLDERGRCNCVTIHRCLQEQTCARACRPWSGKRAKDAARGDASAQSFRFKPFSDEIGDGHRAPAQQTESILLAESAKRETKFAEIP